MTIVILPKLHSFNPGTMSSEPAHGLLNFDIDRYINPWIPHNRLYLFPKPVSRFLGYRAEPHKEPAAALQWPVTFLATVAGLCLVAGIDNYTPGVSQIHPPILIASLGASAVLDFNTVRSPLAQPRNSVIGNTLAAICGVAIAKLFQLNSDFQNILWLSAAFGCGLASLIMSITNTVHPPGGATAVLASIDAQVVAMGWNFVPLVLLDSVLMTIVALIFNNVFRQYPTHWWSASPVGHQLRKKEGEEKAVEEGAATKTILSDSSRYDLAITRQSSRQYSEDANESQWGHR